MSDFGANLRRLRKERKLSMDALAEKAGTSKQVLSRYENGERVPKISMVKKLADALGVSIAQLSGEVFEIKARFPVPPHNNGTADEIEEYILNEEDDELMQMREDMRRNPDLRVLYDLQRKATKSELKQMQAFIKAIRSSNEPEDDDPA